MINYRYTVREENYAGTRSIIHLGDRAAGAAAGDRAVPEFPAAVLPVLGLENHSAADVRQPAYQVRQGRHFLTQFQTFSTALAAAMGTGKHSGRGGGSLSGRCRCNFLDWVSALLGMALTYSENVLALRYARTLPDGTKTGGPMAYLRFRAAQSRSGSILQSLLHRCFAGHGQHDTEQCHFHPCCGGVLLPPLWTGIGVTLLLGIILLRGTRSTGKVIQWLMPVLSAVYLLAALGVIFRNAAALPAAFGQIFREAFGLHAVGGGISGAVLQRAVQTGLRHGVFSNEAGLGSSALVHAGGSSEDAQLQGHVEHGGGGVGYAGVLHADGSGSSHQRSHDAGRQRRQHHFRRIFGRFRASRTGTDGRHHRTVCVLYADRLVLLREQAVRYLGGEAWRLPYRVLFCLAAGVGAVVSLRSVGTLRHCQRAYGSAEPAGAAASGETDRDTTRKITKRQYRTKSVWRLCTPSACKFPSYFTKMLVNTSSIHSAFCFI